MSYVKNINQDEIRDGYLVTSQIKKVFNKQLELHAELERICKKNDIKYFAYFGTLLGCKEYSGFIPWDNDMDFVLLRPDYNKLINVIENDLDNSKYDIVLKNSIFLKIGDKNSTIMTKNKNRYKFNGILIDVLPLDIHPDGSKKSLFEVNRLTEMLHVLYDDKWNRKIELYNDTVLDNKEIKKLIELKEDVKEFHKYFSEVSEFVYNKSECVGELKTYYNKSYYKPSHKKLYIDTVYLPFETIKLPCPNGYEEILKNIYGEFKRLGVYEQERLGTLFSTDIPYKECAKQLDLDFYN